MHEWLYRILRDEEELTDLWLDEETNNNLYVESLSMLFFPLLKRMSTLISKLEAINQNIIHMHEYTQIKLDCIQNNVYTYSTYINILMVGASCGVYITALYGMNLDIFDNPDEPQQNSFFDLTITLCLFIVSTCAIWMLYIRYTRTNINSDTSSIEDVVNSVLKSIIKRTEGYEGESVPSSPFPYSKSTSGEIFSQKSKLFDADPSFLDIAVLSESDVNSADACIPKGELLNIVFDKGKYADSTVKVDLKLTVEAFVHYLHTEILHSTDEEQDSPSALRCRYECFY